MRNKIFVSVFAVFLLLVMLAAPAKRVLCAAGLIVNENVGNIIEVEHVYGDDVLFAPFWNGVEAVKRELTDIYTNYIPFYVDITSLASTATQSMNAPVSSWLMERGNRDLLWRLERDKAQAAETTTVLETTTAPPETTGPSGETTPVTTAPETTKAPETTAPPEPPFEPIVSATYLKANSQHRYYQIDAQTQKDGPKMSFYVRIPTKTNEQLKPTVESMVAQFNKFAEESPDVNWYMFAATCFEDTDLCTPVLPSESKKELFTYFFDNLSSAYKRDWNKLETYDDKYNKFFLTDHHWNVYGYTEAYMSLANMFKENYSDITIREPEIITFPDVKFAGSNATATGRYNILDDFAVATYGLPVHDIVIENGVSYNSKIPIETNMQTYLAGKQNTNRTYGHYTAFQPILEGVTYPENKTGRNLLFIGDSYSPPLMEPLACYFDNTYIRYVDSNPTLENIDLDQFIKDNNITDVVFVEMSVRLMYNYYNDTLRGLS